MDKDLFALHELCARVSADIKARCAKIRKKKTLSEEDFQLRLGFFPAIRKVPGFETALGYDGFDAYFAKYEGEDQEKCLQWLDTFYGITDEDSFFNHIQSDWGCNLTMMANDALAQLKGKPNFDIEKLDENGRFAFENMTRFMGAFAEYLPAAGIMAWDICEKIGFARHAYRCGIIGRTEYCRGMMSLGDSAVRLFSSWEEYMHSLIYGCGVYAFYMDRFHISSAIDFISAMAPLLLNSDLADSKWNKPMSATALKKIWGYKKRDNGTLLITSYKGTSTEPIVPEYIEEQRVTAIGTCAFSPEAKRITEQVKHTRECITSVSLPEGIDVIGNGAFLGCVSLAEIIIPDSVIVIDYQAFAKCESLTHIIIPENVEVLGKKAFYLCTRLAHAQIKSAIGEIPPWVFNECWSLKDFVIPQGVEVIEYYAFENCKSLEAIKIPKGVREIKNKAFAGCSNLKTVEIEGNLDLFLDYAFVDCLKLEEIKITGGVQNAAGDSAVEEFCKRRGYRCTAVD